jgi:drug/metabolite transporter (DMT)-like permease
MTATKRLYVLLLLTSVLLGTQFPASKFAVAEVDPWSLTAFRTILGAVVASVAAASQGRLTLKSFRNRYVWSLGALLALVYVLLNAGIERTTASKTALFVNVSVVYVAIVMSAFFHERMSTARSVGIAGSIGGVVVLTTNLDPGFLAGGEFLGDILVFLSGLSWAAFVIFAKRNVAGRDTDESDLTAAILAVTGAITLIPPILAGASAPSTAAGWASVLYLGFVPTFIPLLLFLRSMRSLSPTVSSILITPAVVVAAFLSYSFLEDPIGLATIVGGALVLVGAYVITRDE